MRSQYRLVFATRAAEEGKMGTRSGRFRGETKGRFRDLTSRSYASRSIHDALLLGAWVAVSCGSSRAREMVV